MYYIQKSLLFYNVYYVYVTELIEPNRRSVYLPFVDMMSGIGTCLLSLVAYLSNSWFDYTLALTLLSVLSSALILYMPESTLWLESKEIQNRTTDKTLTLITFFRSKRLLKSLFQISVLFSGSMLSFYGLSLSIGSINGNIYLNFAILGVADAISSLVLVAKESDFILGVGKMMKSHTLEIRFSGTLYKTNSTTGYKLWWRWNLLYHCRISAIERLSEQHFC